MEIKDPFPSSGGEMPILVDGTYTAYEEKIESRNKLIKEMADMLGRYGRLVEGMSSDTWLITGDSEELIKQASEITSE